MRRKSKRRENQGGFSLVEVVAAMTVLIIGIMGVLPMLAFNLRANSHSRNYGQALLLASQRVEQLRSWPNYEASGGNPGLDPGNPLMGTHTVQVADYGKPFTITTTIMRNGYSPNGSDNGWDSACSPSSDNSVVFASSGSGHRVITEWSSGAVSLNTGPQEYCNSSSYRGEDFVVVRVVVTWTDLWNETQTHSVARQAFIARY
jgi:Tfp pilus assembly protein PilV